MKAILFAEYGSPDVLQFKEVEKPTPAENQVLIKVHAAAANPLDWHRMRGAPFLVRTDEGLTKPKNPKFGADVAGRVEAVGSNVTRFKVGDEVFGDIYAGSFAEYAVGREGKLTLKPANISFEEAAAAPVAAITALQGLRDTGKIKRGQKVLVNGASGGVGTYAVQLAKYFGTEVTAVCSTPKRELVRSIGADHVVDYRREDFTQNGKQYDLIYDAVGNRSIADYQRALTTNGVCVIAGFTTLSRLVQHIAIAPLMSKFSTKKVGMMGTANTNPQDLGFIKELLESGAIKSVIDRCYPLNQTADAIRYLEEGHARGKVIITVSQ